MGARYFFILLLILAACETALQTIPTSEYTKPAASEPTENPCEGVSCTNGQICQDGICTCGANEKLCDNKCIDENACCTNDDCDSGNCENNVCTAPEECKFGEELKKGECKCTSDKIYCEEQDTCIDREACCMHTECDKFERCVPTLLRSSICLRMGEKKICKAIGGNGRAEIFNAQEHAFRITAQDWWGDGSITFEINDETIRVPQNGTVEYTPANATIFHEGIEVIGGYCKEDEEI